MEKLELKHLAGYLPYGLKMLANNDFVSPKIRELTIDGYQFIVNTRKPILRPLSDLTKEIEHNGEKFMPIRKFYDMRHVSESELDIWGKELINDIKKGKEFKLSHFEKLYEWHFDIHRLIEKELAVDINTLK